MAQRDGKNQRMLIETRPFTWFSAGRAALFDDAVFEWNEVMLFFVAIDGAGQVRGLAVQPIEMRWIDGILHRLQPITVIDFVLLDPALAVLPGQHVPTRQQGLRLRSQVGPEESA